MYKKPDSVCDTQKEKNDTNKFTVNQVPDEIIDKVAYHFAEQVKIFYQNKDNLSEFLKWKEKKDSINPDNNK